MRPPGVMTSSSPWLGSTRESSVDGDHAVTVPSGSKSSGSGFRGRIAFWNALRSAIWVQVPVAIDANDAIASAGQAMEHSGTGEQSVEPCVQKATFQRHR